MSLQMVPVPASIPPTPTPEPQLILSGAEKTALSPAPITYVREPNKYRFALKRKRECYGNAVKEQIIWGKGERTVGRKSGKRGC